MQSKQMQSRRNHMHFCARFARCTRAYQEPQNVILMYARMYILRSILRLRATSGCQMNANRLQLLRAKRASGEFNGTDFLSLSLSTYIYSAGHQE